MLLPNNKARQVWSVVAAALLAAAPSFADTEDKKFSLSVEAGIEHYDNITVSVLDQTTGESDQAVVFDLSASYIAFQEAGREVELSYDFYQSLHDTMGDFDLQIHALSALGSWEIGEYDTGLNYNYSKIYLGSDRLYQSHTLAPSLGFSSSSELYHRLSYGYLKKDFYSNSARDADQHSISLDNYYFFMDAQAYVSAGLRLEEEDARDPELDYRGTYIKLGTSVPLPYGKQPFKLKANYQHYWRNYDNVTASIGQHRDDEQDLITIELITPLYKMLSAKFAYEYLSADSNLPSSDYDENTFTLSLLADF